MTSLKKILRKFRRRPLPELDPDLSGRERVFRGPPLDKDLVHAVRLIAPQFELRADEQSHEFWEADQNGCCWSEHDALKPFLDTRPAPKRVLEIGPGLGRSVVFFQKVLGWKGAEFDLYESDGDTTKYTMQGPRFDDSFCGTTELLRRILDFNGAENWRIRDAKALDFRLSGLPGPYDFLYGFYSIGFHWSLEHFFDEVLGLMHDTSLAAFTVPDDFRSFPALEAVPHKIVPLKRVWPRGDWLGMLVVSKSKLEELQVPPELQERPE